MNNLNNLNTLLNVINQLFAICDYGVNHIEFLFIGVKYLLEEDDKVRKIFFNKLLKDTDELDSLDESSSELTIDIDSDLLCYLAYTTHWPEFYKFVRLRQEVINSQKKVKYSKDLSEAINEALQPKWEDVIFYKEIEKQINN